LGRPFVKRFTLFYQTVVCPVCLSVCPVLSFCNVGVLWPNGWMDQDETSHGGRPRPWHIALDGYPAPLPQRGTASQFSAHNCCGQMAEWIKMPLGMELDFGPGDFVLDGDPAPLPKRGVDPSPIFGPCPLWPNGSMDQDSTWYECGPWSRPHCARWGPSSPPKKGQSPLPNFRPISIVAKRLDASRCPILWR